MKMPKYLFLLCLAFGFFACDSIPQVAMVVKEPDVSLNSVNITRISLSGVDMLARVDVENPNSFTIPLPKIDWELFVNSSSFINGVVNNDKSLTRGEKVTLDLPLSVTYEGLYNSFKSLIETKEAAYDIAMKLSFVLPVLGEKSYNLDFSGALPIIKKPEVSFRGIAKKSLGTTMEFVLTWEVENKNNFDFSLGEFSYDFSVNNTRWARGQVEDPPVIRAGAKTEIPLTVSVSAAAIVMELVTIINRGTAVSYNCTGNMQLQGDLPGLEKFELPLSLGGSTQIR